MPITQCPVCGTRQLVEKSLIGQMVACIRCEKTFSVAASGAAGPVRQMVMAGAALLAGVVVSWMMIRGH